MRYIQIRKIEQRFGRKMAAKRSSRLRFAQTAAYKMSRSVSRVLLSYGHLSTRTVTGTLQPPRERPGRPVCSHTGVAPDRVYSDGRFHTPSGELLPRLSTLTGRRANAEPAVYLCCTFPEVAFGGRYPLSLPCGARTFLMDRLSPLSPRPFNLLINIIV